jgi:hypothetical protein
MADYASPSEEGTGKTAIERDWDENKLELSQEERWDRGMENERVNIRLAYDDLDFMAGNQWPEKTLPRAQGRMNPARS